MTLEHLRPNDILAIDVKIEDYDVGVKKIINAAA
jgi:hypothetical protein